MFEFHGWATIRPNAENRDQADDEGPSMEEVTAKIQSYVEDLHWEQGALVEARVQWLNGQAFLRTAGLRNHAGVRRDLLGLFEYVAQVAPGSYGLLYVLDDESTSDQRLAAAYGYTDGQDHTNEFQVLVLVRGTLTPHTDPFLSPFQPVVENFYTE